MTAVRWTQTLGCAIVVILTILICASAPLAKNINFLTEQRSAGDALSPNSNFNGLIFGVRGFCIKAFCTTYSDYRSNPKGVGRKARLDKWGTKAVNNLAGKGDSFTNKAWFQLEILTSFAAVASLFAFALAIIVARQPPPRANRQQQTSANKTTSDAPRYMFLGSVGIAFLLNISTWGFAFSIFNTAKTTLMENKNSGSWGTAFFISLATWIILLGVLALEAIANKPPTRGANANQYAQSDPYDEYQ